MPSFGQAGGFQRQGQGSVVRQQNMADDDDLVVDDDGDDGDEGQGGGKKNSNLESIMKAGQDVGEARAMARLMQDPDIAAVMRAKQGGKKLRIMEDGSEGGQGNPGNQQTDDSDEPVDYDSLDNSGLVRELNKQVSKNMTKQLQQVLKPVIEQVEQFGQFVQQQQLNTAKQGIQEAMEKYTDFQEFVPQMQELSNKNPNLNAEELYILAKGRSGAPLNRNTRTESERPNSITGRPSRKPRKTPLSPGRAGMAQLLAEATKRNNISRYGAEYQNDDDLE